MRMRDRVSFYLPLWHHWSSVFTGEPRTQNIPVEGLKVTSVKPTIYKSTEHGIAQDLIDSDALYVLEKLVSHGHTAYLVGGCVRDLLLNHKPKDYDISTSALPEEIKPIFRSCLLIGRRFRLAHIRFGKKIIEVATFRKGDNDDDSLIVHDNNWGTEAEDVLRRDFTINGLFYNAQNETVIDYVKGFEDAKNRYLRSIGNPHIRFKQDPVRMIRLIKFRARFQLGIDEEAKLALIDCRSEILKSAKARVLEEILRMMESGSSKAFFQLMADFGILQILLPHVSNFLEGPSGNEIYRYMSEMDQMIKDQSNKRFCRSILLSSIAYPILHNHLLKTHTPESTNKLNLGEIHSETLLINRDFFGPFLQLPKRISAKLTTITTSQFRFTPLDEKNLSTRRIPGMPDFALALDFLKIRSQINPELQELYEEWAYFWKKRQTRRRRTKR